MDCFVVTLLAMTMKTHIAPQNQPTAQPPKNIPTKPQKPTKKAKTPKNTKITNFLNSLTHLIDF